ncbi:COG4315 family predicted lipoprotein [Ancylobacter mangrovi]|uniref:Lipoprotein with Yx(FWY)xxD motif n=1 Tax=Ancylobacter mangrovi TaxID=2972472 RepID=A0A9X2PFB0_9HYPH|nr:hypothetical protein [Ancylobacter mangrovi]MCS0497667.1 hypothetical protein [Ancylobacter mangrovi]MCS0503238.1 hypothetical protein [Ancylobacter mangrovi]
MLKTLSLAVVIMAAAAGSALAAPAMAGKTAKGEALVDAHGMTLYTFSKDGKDMSACNGKCAENWPPLMAAKGAKAEAGYSIVTRQDGSLQWAYKGKPLYTFVKDEKAGDASGDGLLNGAWHVAKP